jgi:hypothetical protein
MEVVSEVATYRLLSARCCSDAGLPLRKSSVVFVDLSRNKLNGTLPVSWLKSPSQLETVNLASNNVTGTVPPGTGCAHTLVLHILPESCLQHAWLDVASFFPIQTVVSTKTGGIQHET